MRQPLQHCTKAETRSTSLCRHWAITDRARAGRANIRVLDALYVELASQLQAPLLTVDRKLARVCALAEDITA